MTPEGPGSAPGPDRGPGPDPRPGPTGDTGPVPADGDLAGPGSETSDLPEAALRRLGSSSFLSGLSVPDFAACLELEPVALVQGFCVMRWGWYGSSLGFGRSFTPYVGGHRARGRLLGGLPLPARIRLGRASRTWGQNLEQPWVEEAWSGGYTTAYARMLEEAQTHGAHGIVGVVDRVTNVADRGTTEFHFLGTAVMVEGGPPPASGVPWSTFLAGQRLIKSIEAGFMPVAVVAALASVRVWAYCMTEYLMEGSTMWGAARPQLVVEQVSKAHMAVRQLARKHVRQQLSGDQLHGASMEVVNRGIVAG